MESKIRKYLIEKFSESFPNTPNFTSLSLESSGLDSLEFMELIMELEDIIGKDLPESLIEDLDQSFEELIQKIEAL